MYGRWTNHFANTRKLSLRIVDVFVENELLDYLIEGITDICLQNQARIMNFRLRIAEGIRKNQFRIKKIQQLQAEEKGEIQRRHGVFTINRRISNPSTQFKKFSSSNRILVSVSESNWNESNRS